MLALGDKVTVLPPFTEAFPGVYTIDAVKDGGVYSILEDRDFDEVFLKKVDEDQWQLPI